MFVGWGRDVLKIWPTTVLVVTSGVPSGYSVNNLGYQKNIVEKAYPLKA